MSLTPDEQKTVDAYDNFAELWSKTHADDDFYAEQHDFLKKLLPAGSKVIEIGCGAGRDALHLVQNGYEYLGTDISKSLLDYTAQKLPDAKFAVSDIYDLSYDGSFDAFWCSAVIIHIPKKRLAEALGSLYRLLRPGGIGFISTKQGNLETLEPLRYNDKYARIKVHYTKQEFDKALKTCGFKIIKYDLKSLKDGNKWMCCFVQKPLH